MIQSFVIFIAFGVWDRAQFQIPARSQILTLCATFFGQSRPMNKIFEISDDSGFMGLVNVDKYDSFVSEDWKFNDLRERFIREMNQGNMLFWSTGQEGLWKVRVTTKKEEIKSFRTISGDINVTDEKLFLTNYEDLSMAAQFQDQRLPLKHNTDLKLRIENGNYEVQINQLFNPDNLSQDDRDKLHFEIVIEKLLDDKVIVNKFDKIPWEQ